MLLVQVNKMIIENNEEFSNGKIEMPYKIECMAVKCNSVGGYILLIKLDGVLFKISSQREEYRVFKSSDTVVKTLLSIGLHTVLICTSYDGIKI